MLTAHREKDWTYDDYRQLPNDGRCYEIIDGVLYVSPAPRTLHQSLSMSLQWVLFELQRAGLGWVFGAPLEVVMPGATPVQPDLVFVADEQRHIITETGVQGVPKLLVEIQSPSTASYDRVTKLNKYAACGVPHYWMLDPVPRVLHLFRLEGATYRLLAALGRGDRFEHPDFELLVLDIDGLYANVLPELLSEG